MILTQTFTMAKWQIVVKKSKATNQTKDQNNIKNKQTNKQTKHCGAVKEKTASCRFYASPSPTPPPSPSLPPHTSPPPPTPTPTHTYIPYSTSYDVLSEFLFSQLIWSIRFPQAINKLIIKTFVSREENVVHLTCTW